MAFQPVPNTVQATIVFTTNSVPAVNVLNFTKAGGYVQADLDALANAIDGWVVASFVPLMNASTIYQRTEVKGLANVIDLQAVNADGAGAAGASGGGQAANVSKAFTLRTGLTGRSARGRIYMAGIPNTALDSLTTVAQGFIDDVLDVLEALRVIIVALGWTWSIVSRYTGGAQRPTGVTNSITSFGTSSRRINSQRGRTI